MCSILHPSFENFEDTNNVDDTMNQCLICWLPSQDNSCIITMKSFRYINTMCTCNPKIHNSCLEEWINKTSSCPICRKPLTVNTPDLTDKYTTLIMNGIVCFNCCLSIMRIALTISSIRVLLLFSYNCCEMLSKPTQEFLHEH